MDSDDMSSIAVSGPQCLSTRSRGVEHHPSIPSIVNLHFHLADISVLVIVCMFLIRGKEKTVKLFTANGLAVGMVGQSSVRSKGIHIAKYILLCWKKAVSLGLRDSLDTNLERRHAHNLCIHAGISPFQTGEDED